jgi:hypothetical protein
MTNYERIKSMNLEELSVFLADVDENWDALFACRCCIYNDIQDGCGMGADTKKCVEGVSEWLKSDYEQEDD